MPERRARRRIAPPPNPERDAARARTAPAPEPLRHIEAAKPEREKRKSKKSSAEQESSPPESWRKRSATGAILTGMALGLREALEPQRDEPKIVMETSGEPPRDLPVEADLEPATTRASIVRIRPWLLEDYDFPDDAPDDLPGDVPYELPGENGPGPEHSGREAEGPGPRD